MTPARFRNLVERALDGLPSSIAARLENVSLVIEEWPTRAQLEDQGLDPDRDTLYGLYEGVPLPEREHNFGMQLPDRITIFAGPLVEDFEGDDRIREQVRITVVHEIAHFFGLDDDEIGDLGYD